MSSSIPAAVTSYQRLEALNRKHLFLVALEAGKLKIKVPVDPASVDRPTLGLQMTVFSLYPHVGESGERQASLVFL